MGILLGTTLSKHTISELARGLRDLLLQEDGDEADFERIMEIVDEIELKASRSEAASDRKMQ